MKVTEHIEQANGKSLFSIEIIPPIKGQSVTELFDSIEPLMEFKPPFVDVTYHREELIEKKHPSGLIQKVPVRRRPGTVGICAKLMERFKVDPVPHVICGGFTKDETEDFLYDLHYLGIDNTLVLRGDPEKSAGVFKPKEGGHAYATDLISQVVDMNSGRLLHEETEAQPTNFCIGVAGYPEKHFEAPNHANDLRYLKKKVELGADYIVTQMFFDNQKYFDFVKRCRAEGINVPIIPGLKPISTKKQLTVLPRIFHLDFPEELVKAVEDCKNDQQVREVGVEFGIKQCKELLDFGVPVLHFYTMGKSDSVKRIAEAVF
ncbi:MULTISPECIES: methylenetetrahydrofolate reductase [NAD(P)H] [unclassified Siphonobacter]|uniref:methylenetetrahydrofolate reductase [NAD(P)H] n=1 Tax=unclassified Siphonobacter TaxID=2635712 RepID=UPI000CC8BC10|nr:MULTISPECIES: methylenetetrahydrofolate reductase [NAD(P)H] [unclassified Siphonobacter]MDQ1089429.1 methylenetetrahydrofolate reductase (NADPH) [Siphonobacter sp. SORGH_AS_1065]MDR6195605.1 methylenetetrahydrofolate reductase (NADPH) [Siphonobacter sp. SORGH_AS_0500]PKK35294.1 methylenetetrahydrofolate reductase [NAD(P)H] [Siphonobacter sp. SORGH_AS_0500]